MNGSIKSPTECSTSRFSDRVANYVKYRPSYPTALIDTLISQCQLNQDSTLADIGSGTGIFTELLLKRGLRVTGVEPNQNMREAAEHQLSGFTHFVSIDGQSESTHLEDASVDLITAAQAFHWFKGEETKQEFLRVLKPGGALALIWNQRKLDSFFQDEYDKMLRKYAEEYSAVNHMNITDGEIQTFYGAQTPSKFEFHYAQQFNLDSFLGRMQSSSYTPKAGTDAHTALIAAAKDLFNQHQSDGLIDFE